MRTHRIATAATVAALAIAGAACSAEGNYDELSPGQEAPADDGLGVPGDGGVDGGGDIGGDVGGGGTDSDVGGGAGNTGGQ